METAHLPLDLLQTFVTVGGSTTMVTAARALGLTQPAVSQQLKRLEQLLPAPVFTSEGKRKVLNAYGRALYDTLAAKFKDIQVTAAHIGLQHAESGNHILRLGIRNELLESLLPHLSLRGPLRFIHLSSDQALAAIARHEIDVAIVHDRPNVTSVMCRKLFSKGLRFVVHPKWLKKGLPLEQAALQEQFLTATPCVAFKPDLPFLHEWCRHCGIGAHRLHVKFVCEDWRAIMTIVERGEGFAIVPEDAVGPSKNLAHMPVSQKIIPEVSFYLLYPADLKNTVAVKQLLRVS